MGEISKTEFSRQMHTKSGDEAPRTTERSLTQASHVDVFSSLTGFIAQPQASPVSLVLFGGISYQHERHGPSSVINWTILVCIKSRPSRDYADSHMAPWSVNWPCHIHHAPRGLTSIGKQKKKKVSGICQLDVPPRIWCAFGVRSPSAIQLPCKVR